MRRGGRDGRARMTIRHGAGACMAALAAVWPCDPVAAADWTIVPRVQGSVAVTDNARSAPRGDEEADIVGVVTPGISATARGDRLTLDLDYALSWRQYLNNSDLSDLLHNGLASANAELIEDFAFVDARVSISQEVIDRTSGRRGFGLVSPEDLETVATYEFSPYLRNRFGDLAQSELRYTFEQTLGGDEIEDATTNTLFGSLSTGPRFTRWRSTLEGEAEEGSGNAVDRRRAQVNAEYGLIRGRFSVLAEGGYEEITGGGLREDIDGPFWAAGFSLRPGPRSSLRLLYGDRYDNPYWSGDASYRIGPRTFLRARYEETVETPETEIGGNLRYLGVDPTGRFIDVRTGLPFDIREGAFDLTAGPFRSERFTLSGDTRSGRNTFLLLSFVEDREFLVTGITESVVGVDFSVIRALDRTTTGSARLGYRNVDFGTPNGREDDTYALDLALERQLNPTLTGLVSYGFYGRNSNLGGLGLRENVVAVTLRKTF